MSLGTGEGSRSALERVTLGNDLVSDIISESPWCVLGSVGVLGVGSGA